MGEPRRDFPLIEQDREFLSSRNLAWEAVREGGKLWLLLHSYPVPPGYTVSAASVALEFSQSYPTTQIDMAYFLPELALLDGRPIPQLTGHPIDGRQWQRWSRHRTAQNPWRPDVDNIETHLLLVDEWLKRELSRGRN